MIEKNGHGLLIYSVNPFPYIHFIEENDVLLWDPRKLDEPTQKLIYGYLCSVFEKFAKKQDRVIDLQRNPESLQKFKGKSCIFYIFDNHRIFPKEMIFGNFDIANFNEATFKLAKDAAGDLTGKKDQKNFLSMIGLSEKTTPYRFFSFNDLQSLRDYVKDSEKPLLVKSEFGFGGCDYGTMFAVRNDDDISSLVNLTEKGEFPNKHGVLFSNGGYVVEKVLDVRASFSVPCFIQNGKYHLGDVLEQIVDNFSWRGNSSDLKNRLSNAEHEDIVHTSEHISKELVKFGYAGVFGIDFIVLKDSRVFITEMNMREPASFWAGYGLKLGMYKSFELKKINRNHILSEDNPSFVYNFDRYNVLSLNAK